MRRSLLALLVPIALLAGACSSSDDSPAASRRTTTSSRSNGPETSGPASSGPGSPSSSTATSGGSGGSTPTATSAGPGIPMTGPAGSSGSVAYSLATDRSEFCYRITVKGLGAVTGSHVHRTDGDVALALKPPAADGTVDTCSASDSLLVEEMAANPGGFYVDVHGAKGVLKATLR